MTSKLPLKVVPPLENDFYKPDINGGPKKQFGEVNRELRQKFANEVLEIRSLFSEAFKEFPKVPAVARVKIKPKAVAKTHRPEKILTPATCPIIGIEGMGEILISVTSTGLDSLARSIENDITKEGIANISTFQSFEGYIPNIEIPENDIAKIKLFKHNFTQIDAEIEKTFYKVMGRFGIDQPEEIKYGRGLKIFRVDLKSAGMLQTLKSYVGTQSLGPFPLYQPVRSAAIPVRAAEPDDFPEPEPDGDYAVVGVIDSGTSAADPYIWPWRVAREVYVPHSEQDNSHGNFVSGLIIHGRKLNHDDEMFPSCSSKIVDIVALERDGTSEDKLLVRIEDALSKYPEVKVWNLSLGTEATVNSRTFSDLAVALDRLQDDYGVTFVVAAGNYKIRPFRGWPPDDLGEADRICSPADSIRSIVVGATAHKDHASSKVKKGNPSPFSRRGPGPLYLPKPELSHIGGNCNDTGKYSQIGLLSLDGNGNLAEDIGTSFATPLISTLFANIGNTIVGGASPTLTRALLVHSAALRNNKIDSDELKYRGFGKPPDIEEILGCEPWQCTLLFELEISSGVAYQKAVFPMPKCLFPAPNLLKANILMTLVHQTDLDASHGSEYCRSNIEVSMGTYDMGKDGKKHQKKRVPEDPHLTGKGYEEDLVKHGFKWSPVKVYRREMPRGITGETWRLDLSVHHRNGHVPNHPQRAALIITISDPLKRARVYDEMVIQMNKFGWLANDLQLTQRLRP